MNKPVLVEEEAKMQEAQHEKKRPTREEFNKAADQLQKFDEELEKLVANHDKEVAKLMEQRSVADDTIRRFIGRRK